MPANQVEALAPNEELPELKINEEYLNNILEELDKDMVQPGRQASFQSVIDFYSKSLTQNEKGKLQKHIQNLLTKNKNSTTWDECHDWLKAAKMLSMVDHKLFLEHSSEILNVVERAVSSVSSNKESKDIHPFDTLDVQAKRLYWIRSMDLTPEAKIKVDSMLHNLEIKIQKQSEEIPLYIEHQLTRARQYEEQLREQLQEKVENEEVMFSVLNPLTRSGSKFERHRDVFVYKFENKDGKTTEWAIDPLAAYTFRGNYYTLRNRENDAMMVTVKKEEFLQKVEDGQVDILIQRAIDHYASEQSDKSKNEMQAFDLLQDMPKAAKIIYLRVYPQKYDRLIADNLFPSMLFTETLRHRYGKERVITPDIIFSDSPKKAISAAIQPYKNSDIPFRLYLEINAHGQSHRDQVVWDGQSEVPSRKPGYFVFNEKMFATDIIDVAQDFRKNSHPASRATFASNACNGADVIPGIQQIFMQNPQLAKYVSLFMATKPDTPTSTSRTKFGRSIDNGSTSRYYLLLMKKLYEGKSYGSAVREADIETKKIDISDAEALINGNLITFNTSVKVDDIGNVA